MYNRLTAAGALALALCGTASAQNYIGLGAAFVPEYEGADDYKVSPWPLVNYERGMFFISPRGGLPSLGLKMPLGADLEGGIFAGMSGGRDSSDSDRLSGLEDIDFHATYGAFLSWHPGRFSGTVAYRQAAKSGYGGTLDIDARYTVLQSGSDTVHLGLGTEWGNSDHMSTWFGVSTGDAARSRAGLRPYSASSGFSSASAYAVWSHRLTKRWSTMAVVGVKTLLGDARDSPLVERETAAFGGVGLTYNF